MLNVEHTRSQKKIVQAKVPRRNEIEEKLNVRILLEIHLYTFLFLSNMYKYK